MINISLMKVGETKILTKIMTNFPPRVGDRLVVDDDDKAYQYEVVSCMWDYSVAQNPYSTMYVIVK